MKPIKIQRKLVITNATWAAGDWTLTTSAPHYIGVGDTFVFTSTSGKGNSSPEPQSIIATCKTGTTGSTIVFTEIERITVPVEIYVDNFGTGFNSTVDFTFQHGSTYNGLIHVVSNGTATSTGVQAFGSIDKIHWVSLGSSTALTAGNQVEISVTKPYVYGRLSIATTAAAGGEPNTVKAWKAGC